MARSQGKLLFIAGSWWHLSLLLHHLRVSYLSNLRERSFPLDMLDPQNNKRKWRGITTGQVSAAVTVTDLGAQALPSSYQFAGSFVQFFSKVNVRAADKSEALPIEAEHEGVTFVHLVLNHECLHCATPCLLQRFTSKDVYLRLKISLHSTQRILILHACLFTCSVCSTICWGQGWIRNVLLEPSIGGARL